MEHPALATIQQTGGAHDLPGRTVQVRRRRLDGFGLEPVAVIKIDAEGHEIEVLNGCQSLVERDRPSFLIEAEERHRRGAVRAIRQFLESTGYRGFMLERREPRPIERFGAATHQNPANVRLDALVEGQTYANNFAFVSDPTLIDRLAN